MRPDGRRTDELRVIVITPDCNRHAEGSALIACGDTQVICTASVEEKVPGFLEGKGTGWVTAEYAMLPRATHTRSGRAGGGRGQEIQRLIGRSLRAAVDPRALGPRQITIDCEPRVDLPYLEDSQAEVDCNFVMTDGGRFVEIQATAEKDAFSAAQYGALVALASEAMRTLFARQREAIEKARA